MCPRLIKPFTFVTKKSLAYTIYHRRKIRAYPVFYAGLLKQFRYLCLVKHKILASRKATFYRILLHPHQDIHLKKADLLRIAASASGYPAEEGGLTKYFWIRIRPFSCPSKRGWSESRNRRWLSTDSNHYVLLQRRCNSFVKSPIAWCRLTRNASDGSASSCTAAGARNRHFDVEKPVMRIRCSGKYQYLARWCVYPESENSWECTVSLRHDISDSIDVLNAG